MDRPLASAAFVQVHASQRGEKEGEPLKGINRTSVPLARDTEDAGCEMPLTRRGA